MLSQGYGPVVFDAGNALMAGQRFSEMQNALADRPSQANQTQALPTPQYEALRDYGGPTVAAGNALNPPVAQASAPTGVADGIIQTANALGVSPLDLATAISYETAGTFDPTKRGPTTQWGQHRGLIQFGEPQAKQYGVDWDDPIGSQLGEGGAVYNYLKQNGVTPGMGLLDIYSTINAGAPGLYNRSDANNGGAPGTVADKVRDQMSGHRAKAAALLKAHGL